MGRPADRPRREVAREARRNLVNGLRAKGIRSESVLAALIEVPRHRFTEEGFVNLAYQDQSLPIGHSQTISQPYIVARMTEALLEGGPIDTVLEIGTGSGYQTAVLARLVPRVFTVERLPDLYRQARALLKELGVQNVHFRRGDGSRGWKQFAPYDGIMVTAAAQRVPPILQKQLVEGGRMVIPIGPDREHQHLYLITRGHHGFSERRLCAVRFVPLVESA